MKFLWKIGGEAGFGIMVTGLSYGKVATRSGYQVFNYTEYPSLIRGGHNTYEVHIADEDVRASKHNIDCLVCLNRETYTIHQHRVTDDTLVLYDGNDVLPEEKGIKILLPFKQICEERKGAPIMVNTIAVGSSIALTGGDISIFYGIIEQQFGKKGHDVVEYNKLFARIGYEYVRDHYAHSIRAVLTKQEGEKQMIITGNDAFSLGAVVADCRFYASYPMTPASAVLATLADWQPKTGMTVRHSEDEIASVNSALGAVFAGNRVATGTSGGGFALMVESLSYAGVAEIPLVVLLGQRPGPATGMPTWTEQGDLLFACHAGHGEFPKIVLAPGDVQEMIDITGKAFNIADIYQLPVIVIGDKFLNESHTSIPHTWFKQWATDYRIDRGKVTSHTDQLPYLRYKETEDGISEMLIPGQEGVFYQANSYEHSEDSHTTENDGVRIRQVHKRRHKWERYVHHHFVKPRVYGNTRETEIVFVSWGSNKGPILDAQAILTKKAIKTAYIHFTHLYPMHAETVRSMFKERKRYVLVENNSFAQFGKLLRMETGVHIEETLLKYNGRPFWPEEIVKYILS